MSMSKTADSLATLRERLKRTLGYVIETFTLFIFLGFSIVILIQIFTRYVVHHPLQWTEEFSRLCYVWMVFLTASVVVDEHFSLALLPDFLKARWPSGFRVLALLTDGIALVVLGYLLVGSYNRTLDGWTKRLPATGLNVSYFYIPLLVGSTVLIVYTILSLLSILLASRGREG